MVLLLTGCLGTTTGTLTFPADGMYGPGTSVPQIYMTKNGDRVGQYPRTSTLTIKGVTRRGKNQEMRRRGGGSRPHLHIRGEHGRYRTGQFIGNGSYRLGDIGSLYEPCGDEPQMRASAPISMRSVPTSTMVESIVTRPTIG